MTGKGSGQGIDKANENETRRADKKRSEERRGGRAGKDRDG